MAKILIVDDDPDTLRLEESILGGEGYRVMTAHNGEEALQRLNDDIPDLILLDVVLPGMSGLEVCEEIRKNPKYRDIPVLMFSARVLDKDRERGLKAGANEYLTKPFSVDALIKAIKKHLDRRRKR